MWIIGLKEENEEKSENQMSLVCVFPGSQLCRWECVRTLGFQQLSDYSQIQDTPILRKRYSSLWGRSRTQICCIPAVDASQPCGWSRGGESV